MNDSTVTSSRVVPNGYDYSIKYWMYVLFGGGAAATNAIVVLVILKYKALRSRSGLLLIWALAFADFVEGFATAIGGLYRNVVLLQGRRGECVTKLYCILLPQSQLWRFSDFATSFMLLAVSLDRYVAVAAPEFYFQNGGTASASKLIGLVYGYSLISDLAAWPYPLQHWDEQTDIICSLGNGVISTGYYQYAKMSTAIASALSAIIYVGVFRRLRKHNRSIAANNDFSVREITAHGLQAPAVERKLTVALGMSCVLTLFLDSIPRAYGIYLHSAHNDPVKEHLGYSVTQYFYLLTKLNAMANFFLYALKIREMRMGILAMFRWRQLPDILDLWVDKKQSVAVVNAIAAARKQTVREIADHNLE